MHQISQSREHISRLIPKLRHKRSIDFIGSAWKFIAGSPDHGDFEIVKQKINSALQNNNQQVIINKMLFEKLQELGNETGKLLNTIKEDVSTKNELAMQLKYKLEIIKEEIVNVEYAINWAKANVVNSFILSNKEVNETIRALGAESDHFINVEEIFEFAEVKIASNGSSIIYIVSIPVSKNILCESLLIKAFKSNNIMIKIEYENILKCQDETFAIKIKCKSNNNLSICNENNVMNITTNTCIPNLLSSRTHNCKQINSQHVPSFELILPGILLLNDFNGLVLINGDDFNLKGNYLIKFKNCTISINNKTFSSYETVNFTPLPAILQQKGKEMYLEEIMSLEIMKELNVNNTMKIELLKSEKNVNILINVTLVTIFIVIILVYKFKIFKFMKCKRIPNDSATQMEELNTSVPVTETPREADKPANSKITKFSQIPLF